MKETIKPFGPTDDFDTIKEMAHKGTLRSLRLTFSLLRWKFMFVGTYAEDKEYEWEEDPSWGYIPDAV